MQRLTEKYAGKLAVLAVNISTKQNDQVLPFLKEKGYTFPAFKANLEIIQAYEVNGVPSEFVIDRNGQVVANIRLASDQRERDFEKLMEKLMGS